MIELLDKADGGLGGGSKRRRPSAHSLASMSTDILSSFELSAEKQQKPVEARLQNIICSAQFWSPDQQDLLLDLRLLCVSCWNVEYNPRKVNAAIIRLPKYNAAGILFYSGKVVVTGSRQGTIARRSVFIIRRLLEKTLNISLRVCAYRIENMIATIALSTPVRLEGLAAAHKEIATYEPELFAGLVIRYPARNSGDAKGPVVMVFSSGKAIITGVRDWCSILGIKDEIVSTLLNFQT